MKSFYKRKTQLLPNATTCARWQKRFRLDAQRHVGLGARVVPLAPHRAATKPKKHRRSSAWKHIALAHALAQAKDVVSRVNLRRVVVVRCQRCVSFAIANLHIIIRRGGDVCVYVDEKKIKSSELMHRPKIKLEYLCFALRTNNRGANVLRIVVFIVAVWPRNAVNASIVVVQRWQCICTTRRLELKLRQQFSVLNINSIQSFSHERKQRKNKSPWASDTKKCIREGKEREMPYLRHRARHDCQVFQATEAKDDIRCVATSNSHACIWRTLALGESNRTPSILAPMPVVRLPPTSTIKLSNFRRTNKRKSKRKKSNAHLKFDFQHSKWKSLQQRFVDFAIVRQTPTSFVVGKAVFAQHAQIAVHWHAHTRIIRTQLKRCTLITCTLSFGFFSKKIVNFLQENTKKKGN